MLASNRDVQEWGREMRNLAFGAIGLGIPEARYEGEVAFLWNMIADPAERAGEEDGSGGQQRRARPGGQRRHERPGRHGPPHDDGEADDAGAVDLEAVHRHRGQRRAQRPADPRVPPACTGSRGVVR